MTWFKVDDSFYDHLKVFDAPDCAVALWVRAGAWAARNLTDGFVPSGMPARLCDDPETAAKELVRRKLWLRVKDGYRFHDWKKYQPTREAVEHDRELATERKRKERERRRNGNSQANGGGVTQASRRDTTATRGVTHGSVTAPRPDPTRPELPTGVKTPADSAAVVANQPPLDGMPEDPSPLERQYTPEDLAFGVARWRMDQREQAGARIIGGGRKGVLHVLKEVLVEAFRAEYTEDEVKAALDAITDGIPSKQQLNRELTRIRFNKNDQALPQNGAGYTSNKHTPFRNPASISAYHGDL
jgi:hypothetical protein